ncbi:MAG: DUF5916 domain-containing protein [bacterium]
MASLNHTTSKIANKLIQDWLHDSAKILLFTFCLLFITFIQNVFSQNKSMQFAPNRLDHHLNFYNNTQYVPAHRIDYPIQLDGQLKEAVWQQTGVTGFTQQDPNEGQPATEKTIVWVAYDDDAVYVGARLFDSAPDSIVARLGRRDQDLPTDFFAIGIDSYHDRQTGFYFYVSPAGAFGEGTIFNDTAFDGTWDGIWDYGVHRDSLGWCVEMAIPYSQLRFTKRQEYVWGFNAARHIQRKNETAFLVQAPKGSNRHVSMYPPLVGIKHIQLPRRLELMPYIVSSGHFTRFGSDDPFNRKRRFHKNAGANVKIGLGPNFTLDGTFNPDFGQVELDPAVVNLTAFETFFEEKRPFFIEGADIFSFGSRGPSSNWGFNSATPSFFYSRRIGREPQGEPEHGGEEDIPANTTILGAVKISGKTHNNWEMAMLQAVTAREYGRVDSAGVRFTEEVDPLTSYSVVRTFKNFKDNRFGLGFLGTSVVRQLRTENLRKSLRKNALAAAVDGYAFLGKNKSWAVNGWLGLTRVTGKKEVIADLQESPQHYFQRPDFEHTSLDTTRTSLNGWAGRVALNKEKGNYYLNTAIAVNSPGFETNDFGFHWRGNLINQHLVLGYKWFQPTRFFRSANLFVTTFRNFDFDGRKISEGYWLFFHGQFLNYYNFRTNLSYRPTTQDITLTRGGPRMQRPGGYFFSWGLESDNRKPFVVDVSGDYGSDSEGGWNYEIELDLEWKPSSRMELEFSPNFSRNHSLAQWVENQEDATAVHTYGNRHIFAVLDEKQLATSLRLNYTFTPRLSFQLFFQPLIATGNYTDLKELARPGSFDFNRYGENGTTITPAGEKYEIDPDGSGQHNFKIDNPNFNFRSLRGTAVLRWEFAPGSTLFFVWTHDRDDDEVRGDFDFKRNLRRLVEADSDNILLLKLSYWWNP